VDYQVKREARKTRQEAREKVGDIGKKRLGDGVPRGGWGRGTEQGDGRAGVKNADPKIS